MCNDHLAAQTIPLKLLEKIRQWMSERQTGQITLDFKDGRILSATVPDKMRFDRESKEIV